MKIELDPVDMFYVLSNRPLSDDEIQFNIQARNMVEDEGFADLDELKRPQGNQVSIRGTNFLLPNPFSFGFLGLQRMDRSYSASLHFFLREGYGEIPGLSDSLKDVFKDQWFSLDRQLGMGYIVESGEEQRANFAIGYTPPSEDTNSIYHIIMGRSGAKSRLLEQEQQDGDEAPNFYEEMNTLADVSTKFANAALISVSGTGEVSSLDEHVSEILPSFVVYASL